MLKIRFVRYKMFRVLCVYVLLSMCMKIILINVSAYRVFKIENSRMFLCMQNETIKLYCHTDVPMAYCGFVHPNGRRYSVQNQSLSVGQCSLTIKVGEQDAGDWSCHLGKKTGGIEEIRHFTVRAVKKIAAVRRNITATHGEPVTLLCATTSPTLSLVYCRFEPPKDPAFSVNGDLVEAKPLLDKYFYPNNKSLDRGDCAVTINKAKYKDAGLWTCGVSLGDGTEYTDQIYLTVEGLYTMSTSTASVTTGTIVIVAILLVLGVMTWRNRQMLGAVRRRRDESVEIEMERAQPRQARFVPSVVVQSPSEPGSSPLVGKQGS